MSNKKLAIGDRAPLFTLKREDATKVSLRDFRGKRDVLLFFYPGDMTSGCTIQLCAVRDDWKKFKNVKLAVFGVNHADADSHKKFIDTYQFPFPLLIDSGKKVSKKYGAIKPYFKTEIIKRSVIGIGKDGKIFYLKRGMPKNNEILKAVSIHQS